MNVWRACLLFAMGSIMLHAQSPERRVAVVIGNSDYHKVGTVNNAAPDAVQIATTLGQLGFTLIPPSNPTYAEPDASMAYVNLGLQDMNAVLSQMEDNIAPGDMVVFYFAGHCLQLQHSLYLMPADAPILSSPTSRDLEHIAVSMDDCVARIREKGASRIIFIVDGCRNNPGGDPAKAQGGLIRAGDGIFIALATAGGAPAKDGNGRRSPMADAFLAELAISGKSVEEIFESVRERVLASTDIVQRPFFLRDPAEWRSVVLNRQVQLSPPPSTPSRANLPPPIRPVPPAETAPLTLPGKTFVLDRPGGTAQGSIGDLATDQNGTMTVLTPQSDQPVPAGWHCIELTGWVVEHGAITATGTKPKTFLVQTPNGQWQVNTPELTMRRNPTTLTMNSIATLHSGALLEALETKEENDGRSWLKVIWRGWVQSETK